MINILIVDDHALIRAAVKSLLKGIADVQVIAEASNGEEALQLARKITPDVVLLDISMPGMSGVELTRRLLQLHPTSKIIALTAHEDDFYSSQLMKAGAAGYLTKDVGTEELVKAIHAVHDKQRYITPHVAEQLAAKYLTGETESPFEQLSQRELEILLMISRGDKPADIAKKLFISAKTVNGYRYRLFDKLRVKSDVELTKLALQAGLIDIEQH